MHLALHGPCDRSVRMNDAWNRRFALVPTIVWARVAGKQSASASQSRCFVRTSAGPTNVRPVAFLIRQNARSCTSALFGCCQLQQCPTSVQVGERGWPLASQSGSLASRLVTRRSSAPLDVPSNGFGRVDAEGFLLAQGAFRKHHRLAMLIAPSKVEITFGHSWPRFFKDLTRSVLR